MLKLGLSFPPQSIKTKVLSLTATHGPSTCKEMLFEGTKRSPGPPAVLPGVTFSVTVDRAVRCPCMQGCPSRIGTENSWIGVVGPDRNVL